MTSAIKALVFDLGGVLLSWDRHTITDLSSSHFLTIMNSTAWHNLDRGLVTFKDARKEFGILLGKEPSVIQDAINQAQESLVVNLPLVQVLLEVKATNPELKLYVMSNLSQEHYKIVQKIGLPWSMFDHIFISGLEGMRKPDICFFQHVVQNTGFRPSEMVMIDDTVENICAARSVGMHGIFVQDEETKNGGSLLNLLQDPLARAERYLRKNARNLHSSVEGYNDLVLKDNFAQLMIWELLGNEDLIYLKWPSGHLQGITKNVNVYPKGKNTVLVNGHLNGHTDGSDKVHLKSDLENGLWNYFYEDPILTSQDYPPDADTTSMAYLSVPTEYLNKIADPKLVLDIMASNQDSDGIMQTYFSSDRPRTTPEVCCNILRAFYRFGQGSDPRIRKTEEWVVSCLQNNACLHGTRYYSTPESFLYFTACLYVECRSTSSPLMDELELGLKLRLEERLNMPTNALALALRVFSCQIVNMEGNLYKKDFDLLLSLQERDGGWPAGHFCRVAMIPIETICTFALLWSAASASDSIQAAWLLSISPEVHELSWPLFTNATARWSTYAHPTFDEVFIPQTEHDLAVGILPSPGKHRYSVTLQSVQNAVLIDIQKFAYVNMNAGMIVSMGTGATFGQLIETEGSAGREMIRVNIVYPSQFEKGQTFRKLYSPLSSNFTEIMVAWEPDLGCVSRYRVLLTYSDLGPAEAGYDSLFEGNFSHRDMLKMQDVQWLDMEGGAKKGPGKDSRDTSKPLLVIIAGFSGYAPYACRWLRIGPSLGRKSVSPPNNPGPSLGKKPPNTKPYHLPSDAVWLITGCSLGIGHALAQLVARASARGVATARKTSTLSDIPTQAMAPKLELDVTSTSSIDAALQATLSQFGRIDIIVNNAGCTLAGVTETAGDEESRAVLDTNFWGMVNVNKRALRIMREENPKTGQQGGVILNVTSMGGFTCYPGQAFYHASKFAVDGWTESVAKEVPSSWNIHLCWLEPSGVKTNYATSSLKLMPKTALV
ncbi:hypothetical protein O1611_g1019 [Lasiodiplodia mahajangana]|uniref:Uncharacterized protein n=1 Tax=Lasiodiplodia mahajangana TaxID=1108764 RepID=A0ACC2JYL0_9PEZI|nr:hypothetical protein O1611_g1019 [Lasiodiplodia mahajangana]